MSFKKYADLCPHRVELSVERRPGNALNIEIGTPAPRCRLRTPENWKNQDPRATRWLASGGSPLVLDQCCAQECPLQPKHCSCGHRAENHIDGVCRVDVGGWPCACKKAS